MSREILFRGKRVDNGEWVEGMLAYFFDSPKNAMIMPKCYYGTRDFGQEDDKGNPVIEDEAALGGFIRVIPETVGQFTGRTDHNTGKKIFQNDIIFVDDSGVGGLPSEMVGGTYKVVWEELSASFAIEQLDGLNAIQFDEVCTYIVTGNIHDNPELLGKEAPNV